MSTSLRFDRSIIAHAELLRDNFLTTVTVNLKMPVIIH